MGGDCFIDKDTVQARQSYCDHIKSVNMAQNVSFEGDVIVMTEALPDPRLPCHVRMSDLQLSVWCQHLELTGFYRSGFAKMS